MLERVEIKRIEGEHWPPEFFELRRSVWGQETGLLADTDLLGSDDQRGIHFLIYDLSHGCRLIASTCAVKAELSDLGRYTGFDEDTLRQTMVSTRSTVHPEYRGAGVFALLVYLAAREARLSGRPWVAAFVEPQAERDKFHFGALPLAQVQPRYISGRTGKYPIVACASDTNALAFRCFSRIPDNLRPYLRERLFVEELVQEVMRGSRCFYEGLWFKAVENCELTRWQYYTTLAQMHIYVRWTTRLLGTAIGITADRDLRKHFIQHLAGEIDHEVMLESDIRHLGFDVDYVKHDMTASEDIRAFMSLQESLCSGPRRDPSLFLAVPFAVEALTAFLTANFLKQLAHNVESWGIEEPERAMTFIASHTRSDGGTDGHWDTARRILHRHLKGERELQEFLSIVRLAQRSLHSAFTSWATQCDIFSVKANQADA
jgi:hypothetical protein